MKDTIKGSFQEFIIGIASILFGLILLIDRFGALQAAFNAIWVVIACLFIVYGVIRSGIYRRIRSFMR